ncbi:MAG TPA: Ku protein, partial [Anaerolineales bacterium]|nr:Ku protein [Anaerolineales bacterium]
IVKGYEYEKGEFVVLKEEDFARVDVEATQTVDIINFVEIDEVDPLLFYKPYYLEVQKGGDKAYTLLRDSLADSRKIAIAKVVIRERQHLAAVKPQKKGLILELMHFPEELLDTSEFKTPAAKSIRKGELVHHLLYLSRLALSELFGFLWTSKQPTQHLGQLDLRS